MYFVAALVLALALTNPATVMRPGLPEECLNRFVQRAPRLLVSYKEELERVLGGDVRLTEVAQKHEELDQIEKFARLQPLLVPAASAVHLDQLNEVDAAIHVLVHLL